MNHPKQDFKEEDYKFLKDTSLWIKVHPDRNMEFNNLLKPIRRDLLDNLELNILNGKGRCVDYNVLTPFFWQYFERNKNIPIFDKMKTIYVILNDVNNINLANYLKILNIIRLNIKVVINEIGEYKKMYFDNIHQTLYSVGEDALIKDNQTTNYKNFLHNRLSQYNVSFKRGSFDLKNIIYCYLLKNKFNDFNYFDFSESKSYIYIDGTKIYLTIFYQVLDMLGILENTDIKKKI